jgi:hypothetical protein
MLFAGSMGGHLIEIFRDSDGRPNLTASRRLSSRLVLVDWIFLYSRYNASALVDMVEADKHLRSKSERLARSV